MGSFGNDFDEKPADGSLLSRLQSFEEQKVIESMKNGALKEFINIFEKARSTGKTTRAEIWKNFFLSEDFLKEQYSNEFADGMMSYLSNWSMEGNYNIKQLFESFLVELAIAYAIIPEQTKKLKGRISYYTFESGFYARKMAIKLWNMQEREYLPVYTLYKPENLTRLYSFMDYMHLKNMNKNNYLTMDNKDEWMSILSCGNAHSIYELSHEQDSYSRSLILFQLYTFWVKSEEIPKFVLEYMYKEYNLKNIEHSSMKKFCIPLKQEIIKQYPEIEKNLFSEENEAQIIVNWHMKFKEILSMNQDNYNNGIYKETESIKEKVNTLFNSPNWFKIRYSKELFEKIYFDISRYPFPKSLTEKLLEFYTKDKEWENNKKAEYIIETLLSNLSYINNVEEKRDLLPIVYENTSVKNINDNNSDFWQYYLMTGFGFRNIEMNTYITESRRYAVNGRCYLPAYINCLYVPSINWQKEFTKFNETKCTSAVSVEFDLPDGKKFKVEFHLNYCLYFLDGVQINKPEYSFSKFMEFISSFEKTEYFFFVLAITDIKREERLKAKEVIEKWLERLSLYPITVPVIAQLLAENNAKEAEDEETIKDIYYIEEGYCFKAVVTDKSVSLYYKEMFGWTLYNNNFLQDAIAENIINKDERSKRVKEVLEKFKQPKPVSLGVIFVEDMNNEKKAAFIIDALIQYGRYKENDKIISNTEAYWKQDNICEPARRFYNNIGCFLTENYCILRYKEKNKEYIFYFAITPYLFSNALQSYDEIIRYERRLEELKRKVKEKYVIAGCFGIAEELAPQPFAIGESGSYYIYDAYHMVKKNSLSELIAAMVNLSEVTEIRTYKSMLSISYLNKHLQYCYSEEALKESVYSTKQTLTDIFAYFTKTAIMLEFAKWLDNILDENVPKLHIVYFELRCEKESFYSTSIFDQTVYKVDKDEDIYKYRTELSSGHKSFVWKIWNDKTECSKIIDEFNDILMWYQNYGVCGQKLKNCFKININCISMSKNNIAPLKLQEMKYLNIAGIIDAIKKRTATTAYSLKINKKRTPEIFDSKFGGLPYWDTKKDYPKDSKGKELMLLAQINLDKNPMEEYMLKGGMLQFFVDAEELFLFGEYNFCDMDKYRIIYHKDIDYSTSKEQLINFGLTDSTSNKYKIHTPVSKELAVDITKKTTYISIGDYRFDEELTNAVQEYFDICLDKEPYYKLLGEKWYDFTDAFYNAGHWLFGYPADLKMCPRCNRTDPRDKNENLRKYDRMFFQFDIHYLDDSYYFDDNHGCGIANFYISSEDLLNKDFSKILYHWKTCKSKKDLEWREDEMDLELTSKQLDMVIEEIKKRTATPTYSLIIDPKAKPSIFDSKFGGLPYWDIKKDYPKDSDGNDLILIAQINFDKIKADKPLPSQGMLQFFISNDESFGCDFEINGKQDTYRVVYHEVIDYSITKEDIEKLDLPDCTKADYFPVFKEAVVNCTKKDAYMSYYDYRFNNVFKEVVKDILEIDLEDKTIYNVLSEDMIDELEEELCQTSEDEDDDEGEGGHRLLGYPYFTQYDPRENQEGAKRYDTLLFQMDSDYINGEDYVLWGDCGVCNFFINKEDLEKKDFSKVIYNWDCC